MTILALVQARLSSSRLPGKVLKTLSGKPMLIQQISRIRHSKLIDKMLVVTSTDSTDDLLVNELQKNNIEVFRGDLNDVLDRFYQAAKVHNPKHVVRLTGDCPLADPAVIDLVIEQHINSNADYTTNTNPPTFPDGLDVEIMKYSVLCTAWLEAELPSEREHVTPYIRNNPEIFNLRNVLNDIDYSSYRWTVDEPEDFEFVKSVYEALYKDSSYFGMNEVIQLKNDFPKKFEINANIERNEGLKKSLEADKEHEL